MDLTCMTVPDVAELIDRLAMVNEVAVLLHRGGLSPVIDLTDDGVMISASWDSAIGGRPLRADDGPVVIEPVAGPVVMKEAPRQQELLVDDPAVIDLHLMSVSRLGDWHMAADLNLLRALLDNLHLSDLGIAKLVGRDELAVAERMRVLTNGGLFCLDRLAERLESLLACALDDEQVAALTAAEDTGGAEGSDAGPAGGQDAEAPPPDKDAARGAFPGGGQDLPAIQPGMTGLSARGEGTTAQSPEPAPAAGESGGAAAEDSDLSGPSPLAEPPAAAATGTAVAAVTAPPLPGQHPPAGERAGAPARWTAEEDDRLVAGIAARVLAGKSRKQAATEMAQDLGRPVPGTEKRYHTKLSGRVDAEIARLARAAKVAAETPAPLAAEVAPAPVEQPAVPAPAPRAKAPRLVAPADLSGAHRRIWDWLDGIDYTADFNAADDQFMVERFAMGTKVAALALDMGVDAKALLDRFKLITQCIRDGKDRIQPDLQGKLGEVLRMRVKALRKSAGV
jgi:hypothetical protein